MTKNKSDLQNKSSKEELLFKELKKELLDPLARELANQVKWITLDALSGKSVEVNKYPIAITGKGTPLLLLHGFDSSFLEFRRLCPLLSNHHQLIIPDLFGFGFCPRPNNKTYGLKELIKHLNEILKFIPDNSKIGLIGASMGGALAMELARQNPNRFNKLLLLSPAGLTGKPMPVPPLIDQLGVWFLSQPLVRKSICRQAFDDPNKSVGKAEEQIASLHLNVDGWSRSLAAFARSGGLANCGYPLPPQPLKVIWGANDRILKGAQKKDSLELLKDYGHELDKCGHLPHLDQPEAVAKIWQESFLKNA